MGQEGDDIVSLPAPPPPNPAARRSAIDAALRKFDGIEDAPRAPAPGRRPGIFGWASSHRRVTGGLVTAALIAVVGVPAMQVALRDRANEATSERSEPGELTADVESVQDNAATEIDTPPAETSPPVPIARNEPVAQPAEPPALAKEEKRLGFTASGSVEKARVATIAPMMSSPASPVAAAPPPPPPPPAPMAEHEAADAIAAESGSIVVTGQLARRQKMSSPSPATAIDPYGDFLSSLRAAASSNDRRALIRLIGFPLKVSFDGDVRTYRSRQDVERDFDRIFTPAVRASAQGLGADGLASRDGGRLKGSGRIWFGCGTRSCSSAGSIKIREVNP